ncbi:hypothetical protein SFRURICE_001519, partial [Spodoptera frugiperda]
LTTISKGSKKKNLSNKKRGHTLTYVNNTLNTRSMAAGRFNVPRVTNYYGGRTLNKRIPYLLNNLPADKRSEAKLNRFKHQVPLADQLIKGTLKLQINQLKNLKNSSSQKCIRAKGKDPVQISSDAQPKTDKIELLACNTSKDIAKGEYEIKVLRGDKVKIQSKSADPYSTIYKELKAKDTEFYCYQPKQDRSFRVVLKNLHPSTDKEDIKIAIEELHHKVINVWNIQNSRRKQALSMCNIEVEPRENNKDIYSVKYLLYNKCAVR